MNPKIKFVRWFGKRLAFAAKADTNLDLYVVNAKGRGLQHVTTSNVDEFTPFLDGCLQANQTVKVASGCCYMPKVEMHHIN